MATFEDSSRSLRDDHRAIHQNAGEPHPSPNMALATRMCKDRCFINLVFVYGTGDHPFRDRFSGPLLPTSGIFTDWTP